MAGVAKRKSYGQFCGLARSLDRVGDRWTLLIVRELLLGDRSFRELEEGLVGIGPSLLSKRLAEMVEDGVVVRNDAPPRSRRVEYRLTATGRSLEPVIVELIRWGATWMLVGPGSDRVDARWAPLALRALLDADTTARGCVHVDVDGVPVTVRAAEGRRAVTVGHDGSPDAIVSAPLPLLLGVAANAVPLHTSGASVSGDTQIAAQMLVSSLAERASP